MRGVTIALAVLCCWSGASSGQSVSVRAVDGSSSLPLRGALVTLADDEDHWVASRLSDARGLAAFTGLDPGGYSVRIEMIGHRTGVREGVEVSPGRTTSVETALPVVAITLDGLEVAAEGRCRSDPEEGRQAAHIWEEARKALEVARWTDEQGLHRYHVERSIRDVELRTGRLLEDESRRSTGWGRTPYRSLPAERLHEDGYVQGGEGRGGDVFYAPDPDVLLSDLFLDHHCLRPVLGEGRTEGWVGLAFRPIRARGVPDISGTLWLDPGSWELQRLDFAFEGLRRPTPVRDIGGEVHFRRLPVGTWIVSRWTIRTPLMGRAADFQGRARVFQVGVREEGGTVLEATRAGGRVVFAAGTGTLEGLLVDSTGLAPVAGAAVELVGEGARTRTDTSGRFDFTRLEPGSYAVSYAHADLPASFRPPPVTVVVERGGVASVRLQLPTAAEVVAASCRVDGVHLIGRILESSSGLPLAGASVTVTQPRTEGGGPRHVTTAVDGWYRACDVPPGRELMVEGRWGPFSAEPTVLRIPPGSSPFVHDVSIALEGAGSLAGAVLESDDGVPVEGVRVELSSDAEPSAPRRAVTDRHGRFAIHDVPVGRHYLSVSHPSYRAGGDSVRVGPEEVVEVEVSLPVVDPGLDRVFPGLAARLEGPRVTVTRRRPGPGPGR